MAQSHEFALDDADQPPAGDLIPPSAVLVVRDRGRRWSALLVPPALIVAIAGVGLIYRVQLADWTGLGPLVRSASNPSPRIVSGPALPPPDETPRLIIEVKSPAAPPAGVDAMIQPPLDLALAGPVPDVTAKRTKAAPAPNIGFDPPEPHEPRAPVKAAGNHTLKGSGPLSPDPPTPVGELAKAEVRGALTQRALGEIRAEAQRRQTERARLEGVKAHELENDRERSRRNAQKKVDRARREANASRADFLEELAVILKKSADRDANSVQRLMEDHIGELDEAISEQLAKALQRSQRLDRAAKINLYRSHGVSESLILWDLWKQEARNIPARNGPRNHDEALIRAARQLLAAQPSLRRASAPSSGSKPSVPLGRNQVRTAQ